MVFVALANICEFIEIRNIVISKGILNPLLTEVKQHDNMPMLKITTMMLCLVCRGYLNHEPFLHTIAHLIHLDDLNVLINSCRALENLIRGHETIKALMENGIFPKLIDILQHSSEDVVLASKNAITGILYNLALDNI